MATTLYLSPNEAATLSGASASAVSKAVEQRIVRTRRGTAGAVIDAHDVGALQVFGALSFRLPVGLKRRIAAWLRSARLGRSCRCRTRCSCGRAGGRRGLFASVALRRVA